MKLPKKFIATLVVALLSIFMTGQVAVAAEPDCDAYINKIRKLSKQFKIIKGEWESNLNNFKDINKQAHDQITAYQQVRKSGDMDGAKRMANEIDQLWVEAKNRNLVVIESIKKGETARINYCNIFAEATASSCANTTRSACFSAIGMGDWKRRYRLAEPNTATYQETWRGPEDHVFTKEAAEALSGNITIAGVVGRAFIERGIRTYQAKPGVGLMAGDIIKVEEGSQVSLSFYGQQITVTEKTSFQIPNVGNGKASPENAVWKKMKDILKGEQFERKLTSGATGPRG